MVPPDQIAPSVLIVLTLECDSIRVIVVRDDSQILCCVCDFMMANMSSIYRFVMTYENCFV